MKKEEYIERFGVEAYEKRSAQSRAWKKAHKKEVIANHQEANRKGGRLYDNALAYNQTGIRGDRNKIRYNHGRQYKPYKDIIAPDSQIHHQWRPSTADYDGVALVEADQHRHGFVNVIEILEGEITLLSEGEIRNRG